MTLVTGTVQDLGYDGMDGTLWARPARFRSDGSVVYAPERKPFKITDGVVSAELAPGPAVLEIQVGSHARGTFEVVIPEEDTTLADLLDTVFPWEPEQVSLFVAERLAAEQAKADAETAAQQAGQDRAHVDSIRDLLDEAAQGNVAPYLTETALNATYGEPIEQVATDLSAEVAARQAAVTDLDAGKLGKAEAADTYAAKATLPDEVAPLVPPLVAQAIAADDTPAQAAASAVQTFMAGHSRATTDIDGLMPAPDKAKLDAATIVSRPDTIPIRDAEGSLAIPSATQPHHPIRKSQLDLEIGRVHQPYRALTTDLNTVTVSGLYEQSASANATLALNYPIAAAGMLRVAASSNGRAWQEYHTFGFGTTGNRTFRRGLYAGAWTPWQEMVRADQLPEPGDSVDMAALDARFAPSGVVSRTQREDEIRRGKGGVIGTAGKGVISFREDHKTDEWLSVVWPLLRERGLPASFGVVSGSIGNPTAAYEPTNSTWDDLKQMFKEGAEIWDHSLHHSNPKPGETFADILTGSRDAIEAQGLRVAGFQQPGAPATYGAGHTSVDAMQDEAGRTIQATYGLFESSLLGTNRRVLPTNGARGHDHVTIDSLPLSSIKSLVDEAAGRKLGIQMMLHADVVGKPGYISLADLTEALDYIAAARDQGRIEVLTASGLAFADPNVAHRFDWVSVPEFTNATTSPRPYGWAESSAGAFTVEDGLLTIPATKTLAYAHGQMRNLGLDGHVFMLDAEVRAPDADATVHLRMTELGGAAQLFQEKHIPITAGPEFTRVRMPVGVPKGIVSAALWVGRSAGGRVQFKNVHLYAG